MTSPYNGMVGAFNHVSVASAQDHLTLDTSINSDVLLIYLQYNSTPRIWQIWSECPILPGLLYSLERFEGSFQIVMASCQLSAIS